MDEERKPKSKVECLGINAWAQHSDTRSLSQTRCRLGLTGPNSSHPSAPQSIKDQRHLLPAGRAEQD